MVSEKEWTKTDHKYAEIIALTTCLSKLEKNKTSILATVKGGGGNITQTHINTKRRYPNKSYVEGLKNIESWRFNKPKEKNYQRWPILVLMPQAQDTREI